jgi:hypothetical protein
MRNAKLNKKYLTNAFPCHPTVDLIFMVFLIDTAHFGATPTILGGMGWPAPVRDIYKSPSQLTTP